MGYATGANEEDTRRSEAEFVSAFDDLLRNQRDQVPPHHFYERLLSILVRPREAMRFDVVGEMADEDGAPDDADDPRHPPGRGSPSRGQAPGPRRRGRVRPDPAPASHRARRRRGHPSRHNTSERPRPVRRVLRRVVDAVGQRQTSGDGVKRRRSGAVAGDWDREGGDREGRGRGLAQVPRARQVRRRRAGDARRPVHGSQGEGDAAIVSKKRRPGRPRRFKRREGGRERGRRAS